MDVLWQKGSATVGEVMAVLPDDPPVAYNTVQTTLRILEQKGYVRHTKSNRAFIFTPLVGRGEASGSAVSHLLSQFFQNSPKLLVLRILEDQRVESQQLERIKKMIEESRVL